MKDSNNLLRLVSAAVLVATIVVLVSDVDSHEMEKRFGPPRRKICNRSHSEVWPLISHRGLTLPGLCNTTVDPDDTCAREITCSPNGSEWTSFDACIVTIWTAGRVHKWHRNITTRLNSAYMDANVTIYRNNGSLWVSKSWTNELTTSYVGLYQAFIRNIQPAQLGRFVISLNVHNCTG